MKKIMFMALAAVAMSFAACGGKTGAAADTDSLAVEATEAAAPAEQANQVVALLQEQIQNADPEQVKAISQQVAEQVSAFIAAGDEAAAEAYTKVINTFICENVEKLQQSGAATAIAEAIATVQNVPAAIVESTTQAAAGVVADANAQAEAAAATVDAAKQAIEAAPEAIKEQAKQQANAAVEAAQKQANDAAAAAQKKANDAAAAAQKKANEQANKAIDDAAAAAKKSLGL